MLRCLIVERQTLLFLQSNICFMTLFQDFNVMFSLQTGSKKLSSLQNLVSLNLTACNLTNSVLSELSGFPSLKYLNLEANQLMGSIQLHGKLQNRSFLYGKLAVIEHI